MNRFNHRTRKRVGLLLLGAAVTIFLSVGGQAQETERLRERALIEIKRFGGDVEMGKNHPDRVVKVFFFQARFPNAMLDNLSLIPELQDLSIFHVELTDAALSGLTRLVQLRSLALVHSKINGAGFRDLAGMTKLETLNLGGSPITDANLEHIGALKSLQSLILYKSKVSDSGLAHLEGLAHLRKLDLRETHITDAGLASLSRLTGLEVLNIGDNAIDDAGVAHLCAPNGTDRAGVSSHARFQRWDKVARSNEPFAQPEPDRHESHRRGPRVADRAVQARGPVGGRHQNHSGWRSQPPASTPRVRVLR